MGANRQHFKEMVKGLEKMREMIIREQQGQKRVNEAEEGEGSAQQERGTGAEQSSLKRPRLVSAEGTQHVPQNEHATHNTETDQAQVVAGSSSNVTRRDDTLVPHF